MWDPLEHEFPETLHGFRCMLAIKYLQTVADTYAPDTVGYDLIRDLISIVRAGNYVEATRRYSHFNTRLQSTSPVELRFPRNEPCCCPHCPRHNPKECLDVQAHVSQAQTVQNVQKP
ncbi:AV2 protein [Ludwigia yellow vein virus]|uniref:Protein V2 n=1 Tax=Ludwigia yellow vein virus TaxID=325111 RepID=Q4GZJ5_9GEMI|nr:AV2 protein [Ludwigia yellow vein virus]QIH45414.1 V2 protein [Ludwigia yellow vein Vietnam virus]QIH45400.1 V2 protein [Ludwigia yellow vein virus]QIH45407.1 V2 protein [Ludwigia yellow vein virus]QIH45435.1 V2 protein [Ludwigia yellow vein Vietnam virus]QIH45442.1 V2 protein [Ludwigia yellow vein Vietnam virus]